MWENIFIVAVIICFLSFIKHLYQKSKIKTIIIADKCSECPFMRQIPSPSEVDYKCSAKMSQISYESLIDMNNSCDFGGKIEIKISKQ